MRFGSGRSGLHIDKDYNSNKLTKHATIQPPKYASKQRAELPKLTNHSTTHPHIQTGDKTYKTNQPINLHYEPLSFPLYLFHNNFYLFLSLIIYVVLSTGLLTVLFIKILCASVLFLYLGSSPQHPPDLLNYPLQTTKRWRSKEALCYVICSQITAYSKKLSFMKYISNISPLCKKIIFLIHNLPRDHITKQFVDFLYVLHYMFLYTQFISVVPQEFSWFPGFVSLIPPYIQKFLVA